MPYSNTPAKPKPSLAHWKAQCARSWYTNNPFARDGGAAGIKRHPPLIWQTGFQTSATVRSLLSAAFNRVLRSAVDSESPCERPTHIATHYHAVRDNDNQIYTDNIIARQATKLCFYYVAYDFRCSFSALNFQTLPDTHMSPTLSPTFHPFARAVPSLALYNSSPEMNRDHRT